MFSNTESPTILIVDDEERLRKALQRSLGQEGYQTRAVASGEEALALLAASRIDLVITDLVMPGVDGLALVRRLKRTGAGPKVIIITAYGSAESMAEAEALGVACYLAKPFNLSRLKSKVNELLEAGEALELSCGESGVGRGRRALCSICSGVGRGLGAIASGSRRALEWVKPRSVVVAVGKVTGAVSGLWCSIQQRHEVNGQ